MSALRMAYLALALWGAVHPMLWFLRHMRDTGTGHIHPLKLLVGLARVAAAEGVGKSCPCRGRCS